MTEEKEMIQDNSIVLGDCLEGLKLIQDNSFDVVFTSPPYADIGTESFEDIKAKGLGNNPYGTHRKYIDVESHIDDWFEWQVQIIDECLRTCRKWVVYNIGAIKSNRSNVYKLIGHYSDMIHDDIIWYKPNGLPCRNEGSISNTYEHILIIKKNPKDMIHVHSHNFRNVIVEGVNSKNDFAHIHHAVMNKSVSDICIKEFTDENDLVLDPFMGVGTTAVSCIELNRRFFGFEICNEYYRLAMERIERAKLMKEGFVVSNSYDDCDNRGLFE